MRHVCALCYYGGDVYGVSHTPGTVYVCEKLAEHYSNVAATRRDAMRLIDARIMAELERFEATKKEAHHVQ